MSAARARLVKLWDRWSDLSYLVHTRLVLLAVWVVGLYFLIQLLANLKEDSTRVTNSFFAIAATLAALSFSAARSIAGSEEAKDTFAYSGERFLHAAVLLITASVIKYAYQAAVQWLGATFISGVVQGGAILVGIVVSVLFFYALHAAHSGLLFLNQLLWKRIGRRPDWDRLL